MDKCSTNVRHLLVVWMTYYEELGVSSSATTEEIHQSYKNLTRLLHPDQHQDERLRLLAECQMKRINEIVEILLDPGKRRRYDLELEADAGQFANGTLAHAGAAPRSAAGGLLSLLNLVGGNWVWVLIAGIGVGSLLWYTQLDVIEPNAIVGSQRPAAAPQSEAAEGYIDQQRAIEKRMNPEASPGAEAELVPELRRRLGAVEAERDVALVELARYRAREALRRREQSSQVVTALNKPERAPSASTVRAESRPIVTPPLAATKSTAVEEAPISSTTEWYTGAWFRARPKMGLASSGLYSPEYIELIIEESQGLILGRYRARYRVPDKAISPEVVFQFGGMASEKSAHLHWTSASGAKGDIRLRLLSRNSMEVNWWTIEFGTGTSLVSGTAVLTRRKQP